MADDKTRTRTIEPYFMNINEIFGSLPPYFNSENVSIFFKLSHTRHIQVESNQF